MSLSPPLRADSPDPWDRVDKLILNLLQDDFPVCPRPYLELSRRLKEKDAISLSEEELLKRVSALRSSRRLRRLGAILNSGPLGYSSTLCAVSAPPGLVEAVADLINKRPEVTHNYIRNHELNIWFTFCHHDRRELEGFLAQLREIEGLGPILELPASKVYKIRAVFNLPVSSE